MAQDHSCDHHGVPFRSLSDHLAAVLAVGKPTATRTVATEESAGLVLAEDAGRICRCRHFQTRPWMDF